MTAVTPGREELPHSTIRLLALAEKLEGPQCLVSADDRAIAAAACRLAAKPAAELDAASNACLELCSRHSFATGHGDTVADIIREIDVQITERLAGKTADEETVEPEELENMIADRSAGRAADLILANYALTRRPTTGEPKP